MCALRRLAVGAPGGALTPHGASSHNVWLIRWITFVYRLLGRGVGLLFVYYHKYIHPSRCRSPIPPRALRVIAALGTLAAVVRRRDVMLSELSLGVHRALDTLLGLVFVLSCVSCRTVVPG